MKYALNIADNNRILSVTYEKYASSDAILVDELPSSNITDYLYINGEYVYEPIPEDIESLKKTKISQISKACNEAIIAGVDVETTQGIEHFSLEETDQINLNAAIQAIQQGTTSYPYHADKQLCRMFSAEEIIAVVQAGTQHKIYHTTLCNHLLVWIRRVETKDELDTITYSIDNLPEDLAINMQSVFSSAAEV